MFFEAQLICLSIEGIIFDFFLVKVLAMTLIPHAILLRIFLTVFWKVK